MSDTTGKEKLKLKDVKGLYLSPIVETSTLVDSCGAFVLGLDSKWFSRSTLFSMAGNAVTLLFSKALLVETSLYNLMSEDSVVSCTYTKCTGSGVVLCAYGERVETTKEL